MKNKIILTIIALLFNSLAVAGLSDELKTYQTNIDPKVKVILDQFADRNSSLNHLEMHMAAYTAARVGEWEIAGFYTIAAPMLLGMHQNAIVYEPPTSTKGNKEMKQSWKKLYKVLEPLKKNKKFKKFHKSRNKIAVFSDNQDVKLKLIHNKDILVKSMTLYEQWQLKIDKDFNHITSVISIKSDQDLLQIFNQLNEIYLKANQDIIKLLEIPRYKELKLEMLDFMKDFAEDMDKNRQPNMEKMMANAMVKREMEQIEIDNLLFPEINWGSWF